MGGSFGKLLLVVAVAELATRQLGPYLPEPALWADDSTATKVAQMDAIAARTPRPGDGLKFISSSGGFAYAAPKPLDALPGQPPFSVIGIAKSGGGYKVTIKEGKVVIDVR